MKYFAQMNMPSCVFALLIIDCPRGYLLIGNLHYNPKFNNLILFISTCLVLDIHEFYNVFKWLLCELRGRYVLRYLKLTVQPTSNNGC